MRTIVAVAVFAGLAGAQNLEFSVLVFSKTAGFRHTSIPNGIAAIRKLGHENNFGVDATEDPSVFTDDNLKKYRAVIFLNTTGDVLNDAQQASFERYIRGGGGFAGVHSATDTEYDWPFYGKLVGAYFKSHPKVQPAEVHVLERKHPSTTKLPEVWKRTDEWYDFRAVPPPDVHILAKVDEKTYENGKMGADHPIAWCQEYEGGRVWYTAMGHTEESYTEPLYVQHLLGGIRAAAGVVKQDCRADSRATPRAAGADRTRRPGLNRTR